MSLTTLPPELLLNLIPQIPHDPTTLLTLHLTHPLLHSLLLTHEKTLVPAILSKTYSIPSHSSSCKSPLFPSLQLKSYADLAVLHERTQVLEGLQGGWLRLTCHGPELGWGRGRWEAVHRVGTLLLWRLGDVGVFSAGAVGLNGEEVKGMGETVVVGSEEGRGQGQRERRTTTITTPPPPTSQTEKASVKSTTAHAAKADLLNLLPATSLACLIFKCYSAVRILRVHGPEPVHSRCGWEDAGFRCEVELAVEELLLGHGVELFEGLLAEGTGVGNGEGGKRRGEWAVG